MYDQKDSVNTFVKKKYISITKDTKVFRGYSVALLCLKKSVQKNYGIKQ